MSDLHEVPTEELLSFQDYAPVHAPNSAYSSAQISVDVTPDKSFGALEQTGNGSTDISEENLTSSMKSFWTIEYYQKCFDVDTKDVVERLLGSIIPRSDYAIKNPIKEKPDLYGPFWVAVTLVFTIAISGNVANYLQHANMQYHWKYDFHLVSIASTTIFIYNTLVPTAVWVLLNWSSDVTNLDGLEDKIIPSVLEVVCHYGYSLSIYIPVSILWSIQVGWLQWLLVVIGATLSGSVLLLTLMPSFRLSRHKLILICSVITCHLLLAVGFMLYFFHVPNSVAQPTMVHTEAALKI